MRVVLVGAESHVLVALEKIKMLAFQDTLLDPPTRLLKDGQEE